MVGIGVVAKNIFIKKGSINELEFSAILLQGINFFCPQRYVLKT